MIDESPFDVPSWLHALGRLVQANRNFWIGLGQLETAVLKEEIARLRVQAPIYICGLARSGSTLLHEFVCAQSGVATHRLKDFPMVFTPYWWRRATAGQRPQSPRERPHRDGMLITQESPDAIEEMLWMPFFPHSHDPSVSSVLAAAERCPAFETFYEAHIRKLLLAEHAQRYAAKNNYHIARLGYLLRLFPDARFIIPLRAPESHVASLLRQQRWFTAGQRKYRRSLATMQWSGHFEFGLDRRPIHLDAAAAVRQIRTDWAAGHEIRGLARYWSMVYAYLHRLLAEDPKVRSAALTVRFETLCQSPAETLRAILAHCGLPQAENVIARHAAAIRLPHYYESGFSNSDRAIIQAETAEAASLWGYP